MPNFNFAEAYVKEKEMKSDHRHELKTNELAEWLGNLPEWTKENLVTIIAVVVVVAVAGALYGWRLYSRNVLLVQEEAEFTNLLNQIPGNKMQILQGQEAQGRNLSFLLLQPANNLQTFAKKTSHKRMAALALIKRAEALRAELHYGSAEEQYLASQTNLAKASYAEAIEKCPKIPSLAATAKFGLGLCEEELGNFGQARQMYQDIAGNSEFESTLAAVQAKRRLQTMADYQQNIVFKPAPKAPEPMTQTIPTGTGQLPNIIPPFNIYRPLEFDMLPESNQPVEANLPMEIRLPVEPNLPVDGNLDPPTSEDSSVQVIPLSNKEVLAVSDEDITQMFEKAGFSHSDFFEQKHIKEVRDGLAESGAVQIKIENKVEAVFAVNLNQGNRVYVTSRKRGSFIYNVNESDNIPKASDVNAPEE